MIKLCALMLAIAACGGSAKSTTGPGGGGAAPPATECDITARHLTEAVFKWKEPPPTTQDNVFAVLRGHCNSDGWSAEAMKCFQQVTDEASSQPCAEKLTKEQVEKVMASMESKFEQKGAGADTMEGGSGTRAPASAPPAPGGPVKGADPCEGGE